MPIHTEHGIAGELGLGSHQHASATTPLLATSTVPPQSLFPVHKLRPRDGLTMDRHKFKRDAFALLAAFGLAPAALDEDAPPILISAVSTSAATRKVTHATDDRVAPAALQEQQDALAAWQRVNTALYWHLVPAIDIDGPFYLQDSSHIDSLVSGQRASGRKLLRWALSFGDVSGFSAQLALSIALAQVRVAPGATLSQLGRPHETGLVESGARHG